MILSRLNLLSIMLLTTRLSRNKQTFAAQGPSKAQEPHHSKSEEMSEAHARYSEPEFR